MNKIRHPRLNPSLSRSVAALFVFCTLLGGTGAALAQSPFSNALSLNGVNQYVSVPNGIWFSNQFTVESWVYVRSVGSWSRLMEFGDGPGTNNVLCALSDGTTGQPIFQFYNGSQVLIGSLAAPAALPLNVWTHLAFTYDGTNGTILTNGVPAASGAMSAPPGVLRTNNYIGRSLYTADTYANVILDEFRLWSTARSPWQIQTSLGHPLTGNESNLILYYRFDETSGTVATNSAAATGTADNGTLVNGPVNLASTAPATQVLNTNDFGPYSLRSVISNTPAGLTITFATNLSGATITLTNGELLLNTNLNIDASSLPGGIQINGNGASRIFEVASGATNVLTALTITNGLVSGSFPGGYGGGIYNNGCLTLSNCTLAANSAFVGGALYNRNTVTINGCTLSGNSASYGGGIQNEQNLFANNSTFWGNTASTSGGGINATFGRPVALNSCTLSGNSCVTGAGLDISGSGTTITNTIIAGNLNGNNVDGTAFVGINNLTNGIPLLAPLGNYGGPTQTMPPLPGSPAIDAGSDSATNSFATDQRGLPRLSGLHVDIGAVEVQFHNVTTLADSGVGSLRQTILAVSPSDIINFAANLSGATITLTSGPLALGTNVTIDASALPGGLLINGNAANRVFEVAAGTTVILNTLTITNGVASDYGGGIYNLGNLTANNCTLAGNSAEIAGGAVRNTGTLTINECTLSGNTAGPGNTGYGGGIASLGTLTVNQSTFSGNSAAYGGGIYIPGTATVNQSTLSANFATTGSGIDVAGGNLSLTNSIVAGNTGSSNISGSFAGASNLTNGNPQLAPLGNYGGPAQTMPPLPGSPAIDAAINSTFTTDQRGYARPLGAGPDIGAVEVAWPGSDPFGNALFFNGNQSVTVSNFSTILPADEVTVEFWAYATATGPGTFALNPDNPANRFYAAVNYPDGSIYWEFGFSTTGGTLSAVSPPNSISNWVHYSLVASHSGNYMSIYTNGSLYANMPGITVFGPGAFNLEIGAGFNGFLDEFRVWNYALSEAQITAGMNHELTGSEQGLVLYYNFDSVGANVVTNIATATGAAYNGAAVNNPTWENAGEPFSTGDSSGSVAYTFSTLAGSAASGSSDGAGDDARFYRPNDAVLDASGNIYVVDTGNNTIRKITQAGVVTTFAGQTGNPGFVDGTGSNARFNGPNGIAIDHSGNLYVTDRYNGTVRMITPAGLVTTLPLPYSDAIAVDNSGTLYLEMESSIFSATLSGGLTQLAGTLNQSGYLDGIGTNALFSEYIEGLAVDNSGNIYVSDYNNANIRKIAPVGANWVVTTVAGSGNPNQSIFAPEVDGVGTNAVLDANCGIAVDSSTNLYVADRYGATIRKITPVGTNWQVTTLAGMPGFQGAASRDGTGTNAQFYFPNGIALDNSGNVYVVDPGSDNLRKVTSAGVVTTLAGEVDSASYADGTGVEARFDQPQGMAVDSSGNIYVADNQNALIRKITSAGVVTTLAGQPGVQAEQDGVGNNARFAAPQGIAIDSLGNLYVTDFSGVIRKVTQAGVVSTIAGPGSGGYQDGVGTNAGFQGPTGITIDPSGNLYVTDLEDNTIRIITTNYMVSTIAGAPASVTGTPGYPVDTSGFPNNPGYFPFVPGISFADGTGAEARFYAPYAIAIDKSGNLYVADFLNYAIRKLSRINPAGGNNPDNWIVTTLAGQPGTFGSTDGTGGNALFGSYSYFPGPIGVAADSSGSIFVTDAGSDTIRRIAANGVVTTVGGVSGSGGSADGTGVNALFNIPWGIAVDSSGALYVADHLNNTIRKGIFSDYAPANQVPFSQPPTNTGALTVTLTPGVGGQWRFPWEQTWRNSGTTATNLGRGEYLVQFSAVPGYLIPALTTAEQIPVFNGQTNSVTFQYFPTFTSVDTNSDGGSLTVEIVPAPPAGSGWQFLGNPTVLPPGYTTNLVSGAYVISFLPVAGFATPPNVSVQIGVGTPTVLQINYAQSRPIPAAFTALPVPVPSGSVSDETVNPFGYNGQLQTDVGYGSGVAVQTNVVLTAAHLIFDDQTLSYVNQAYWFSQQETGVTEPFPLLSRGWFVLSGYAAQRSNDVLVLGPDQSSPQSRNMDVAALYFQSPVAGGGYGGYLPSDNVPNEWLAGTAEKMLVGYPVDGSQFESASIVPGTMYQTLPQPYPLTEAFAPTISDQQVYTAGWFLSYPGNSGGPLYVDFDGYFYPAGVYLGTLFDGVVPYASAVRAIDSNVVNLVTLAASLGDSGTNNSGGGVITIIPGQTTSAKNPGYLILQLGPPSAVQAGAAWKLTNQPVNDYSVATPSLQEITSTNALVVQFKPIPGWNLPTNRSVTVVPGLILTNVATYTVTNPVLTLDLVNGLRMTGTTNTTYQIQSNSSLNSGTWIPFKTNTLTNTGFNVITNLARPGFYRALWLTN